MALGFSPDNLNRLKTIISRYPDKMAACLPALYLAQKQFGHVSPEVQGLVAQSLDLTPAHVHGVATFYSMFLKKPVGKFHIQVCTNVSCMICGSGALLKRFEECLHVKAGGTTSDKLFTLSEVECLAYCGTAPAVQINDTIVEGVHPDKVEALIEELKVNGQRM